MKRLDVNAAGIWEPKKGDVLCSRHFKKTDFDRSAPNLKLKPGVIPSVFDSPYHLQVSLWDTTYINAHFQWYDARIFSLLCMSAVYLSEMHSFGFFNL